MCKKARAVARPGAGRAAGRAGGLRNFGPLARARPRVHWTEPAIGRGWMAATSSRTPPHVWTGRLAPTPTDGACLFHAALHELSRLGVKDVPPSAHALRVELLDCEDARAALTFDQRPSLLCEFLIRRGSGARRRRVRRPVPCGMDPLGDCRGARGLRRTAQVQLGVGGHRRAVRADTTLRRLSLGVGAAPPGPAQSGPLSRGHSAPLARRARPTRARRAGREDSRQLARPRLGAHVVRRQLALVSLHPRPAVTTIWAALATGLRALALALLLRAVDADSAGARVLGPTAAAAAATAAAAAALMAGCEARLLPRAHADERGQCKGSGLAGASPPRAAREPSATIGCSAGSRQVPQARQAGAPVPVAGHGHGGAGGPSRRRDELRRAAWVVFGPLRRRRQFASPAPCRSSSATRRAGVSVVHLCDRTGAFGACSGSGRPRPRTRTARRARARAPGIRHPSRERERRGAGGRARNLGSPSAPSRPGHLDFQTSVCASRGR